MEKTQRLSRARENWVDTVKIFACILVVLGHFFQSMVKSGVISHTEFYGWFNQTIYFFHVPLFFICSGYLFQKFTSVRCFGEWKNNFLKKLLSLAVPYTVFSVATYVMKVLFSDAVNREADGLFETLFLNPVSPYWYLYALIFIFLFTISINSNRQAVVFIAVVLVMKGLSFVPGNNIYALQTVLENEIWFVAGMLICFFEIPAILQKIKALWGLLISAAFIAVSVFVYLYTEWSGAIAFGMGVFGCVGVLLIAIKNEKSSFVSKTVPALAKYTFPVFLMHTIFAAGLRSVLFKIGISNSVIHIAFGIFISFLGAIIATVIMSKIKCLEFLLYPNKYIRIGAEKNVKKT